MWVLVGGGVAEGIAAEGRWSVGKVGEAFARDFQASCAQCLAFKTKADLARGEAQYWRVVHHRAVEREVQLKQEVEELRAKLRLRERQLFERRSERGSGSQGRDESTPGADQAAARRKRGQQRGAPGHGRRLHADLALFDEAYELVANEQRCAVCQQPFEPFEGTDDSEVVEIDVRAYRRLIRRKRYRRTCQCDAQPAIVTATGAPKLIAKGSLGISVWVLILLDKFLFQRPTYRLLAELDWVHGLKIAQGTVTGGLNKLRPVFEPLMEAMVTKNLSEHHWHADETRWAVFCKWEAKVGHRWYLWVFQSPSTVVFKLDPSRSAQVVLDHFGKSATGILNVDRYVAYKVLAKEGRIVLAFCWAHVRRDFLAVAKDWGGQYEVWAFRWMGRIAELYRLNHRRLAVRKNAHAFGEAQAELCRAVEEMGVARQIELGDAKLPRVCRKVLESLREHWQGLVVFVDHPEVPMDNNTAERTQRNPVVGRKNYYGSGSYWSGQLAAMMFSVFQTLLLWNLNPRRWLTWYLEACAKNGGRAPVNASEFLPWNLSDVQRCWLQACGPRANDSS